MFNLERTMIRIPNASFSTSLLKMLLVLNPALVGENIHLTVKKSTQSGSRFKSYSLFFFHLLQVPKCSCQKLNGYSCNDKTTCKLSKSMSPVSASKY